MALSIATFNVKDLLEPRTDRERAVLPAKLDFVARTLAACDADVVGLQEIGPPELLEAVLQRLPARGGYGEPIIGTADARGIRCALLSRVRVVEARVHTADALPFPVFREGDAPPFGERIPLRRGVVHARVDATGLGLPGLTPLGGAATVDVLVVHFKSSRPVPARDAAGNERQPARGRERSEAALRSLVWRAAEALHVRGLVDDVMARARAEARAGEAREAAVVVVGDLNDVPDSVPVRTVRGEPDGQGGGGAGDELLDCTSRLPARERFSVLHDGRATQIDHVLASASLYARLEHAAFLNAGLRQHPPVRGAHGEELRAEPEVDSDHAPLVARFG